MIDGLPVFEPEYKTSPYRWFLLMQYSLAVTSSAYMMMTFSPISKITAEVFGVDDIIVNSCVMVFLVTYVVLNFICVQALEKLGLKTTFKICAIGTMLGAWGRYLLLEYTSNFMLLLIPQSFIAVFQPFICIGCSKLATVWFSDSERALATAVGSLSVPLGCITGMILGPFFVDESDLEDYKAGREHIQTYMFWSAVIVSVMSVPLILFY